MQVEEFYRVKSVPGVVCAGTVLAGKIKLGTQLLIGPNNNGQFDPVEVTGLHVRNENVKNVVAGQAASLSLTEACILGRRQSQM